MNSTTMRVSAATVRQETIRSLKRRQNFREHWIQPAKTVRALTQVHGRAGSGMFSRGASAPLSRSTATVHASRKQLVTVAGKNILMMGVSCTGLP